MATSFLWWGTWILLWVNFQYSVRTTSQSPCCPWDPGTYSCCITTLCPLDQHLPIFPTSSVLVSASLYSVFLDSTHKWGHMTFVVFFQEATSLDRALAFQFALLFTLYRQYIFIVHLHSYDLNGASRDEFLTPAINNLNNNNMQNTWKWNIFIREAVKSLALFPDLPLIYHLTIVKSLKCHSFHKCLLWNERSFYVSFGFKNL